MRNVSLQNVQSHMLLISAVRGSLFLSRSTEAFEIYQKVLRRLTHCLLAIQHVSTLAESTFNANALRVGLTLSRELAAAPLAGLIAIRQTPG